MFCELYRSADTPNVSAWFFANSCTLFWTWNVL